MYTYFCSNPSLINNQKQKKLRQVTLAGTRRAAIRCYVQIQDINAWFDLENIKNKNLSYEFNF
jgi:hypothetical protein